MNVFFFKLSQLSINDMTKPIDRKQPMFMFPTKLLSFKSHNVTTNRTEVFLTQIKTDQTHSVRKMELK